LLFLILLLLLILICVRVRIFISNAYVCAYIISRLSPFYQNYPKKKYLRYLPCVQPCPPAVKFIFTLVRFSALIFVQQICTHINEQIDVKTWVKMEFFFVGRGDRSLVEKVNVCIASKVKNKSSVIIFKYKAKTWVRALCV